jgi:hypothetical protein
MPTEAPEATAGELDVIDEPTVTAPGLFGTDNPKLVVARAVEVADELARVIRAKKLSVRIGRKEHVLVEGWTLLGTMLGVFPVLEWSRKLDEGWEARVEAKTLDGRTVGAAESECLREEQRWAKADDYAVRSMAATRATSKALRQPLGFVMHLAGFDATPAEEMPAASPEPSGSRAAPVEATDEQNTEIRGLIDQLAGIEPTTDWAARARVIAGAPGDMLTGAGAVIVIEKLRYELAQRQERASA